jgi:hypothetical protein
MKKRASNGKATRQKEDEVNDGSLLTPEMPERCLEDRLGTAKRRIECRGKERKQRDGGNLRVKK